jgi:hypothetical protein
MCGYQKEIGTQARVRFSPFIQVNMLFIALLNLHFEKLNQA